MTATSPTSDAEALQTLLATHSDALLHALPAFLKSQRWFGAKSRRLQNAGIEQLLPVVGTAAFLAVVKVQFNDGDPEMYLLPLAAESSDGLPPSAPVVAHVGEFAIFDATFLPAVRAALLAMTEADVDDAVNLPSRLSAAEQSNTSIVFGDKLILKVFRKLQTGENPDVEVSRFLTTVAGFTHIPAYRGSLATEDGTTLAFLQDFARNDGDGWEWMTNHLFTSANSSRIEANDPTIEAATLLGRRTAELHLALATPTDDHAFCAEAISHADLAEDAVRLQAQADSAFAALRSALQKIAPEYTTQAAALLARRNVITAQAQALATASPFRAGHRIRIHGDFHLGQVLRTADDFLIVDFEGEPAKPLAQRRRKQSPLRDLAGMLRSFSYAAATAAQKNAVADTAAWEAAAREAFLGAYNNVIAALPELAPQTEQTALLLRAYLLEKSLYELLYELNNRPAWVPIPLAGILSLLEEPA